MSSESSQTAAQSSPTTSHASPRPRRAPDPRLPVRAPLLLRVRAIWLVPLVVASVVVVVMTTLYIWSVVNPLAHLRGLPVAVVNEDRGATIGSQHLDVGDQIVSGLFDTSAVSLRLHLALSTLPEAQRAMGRDDGYATLVIPANFTESLLNVAGLKAVNAQTPVAPRVEILTNQRAGTIGTQLASGILESALSVASHQIGRHLAGVVPAGSQSPATKVFLADPLTVTTAQYRPLPASSALGLSAFYVALLTLMCGFLGATIVNSVVDSALGYATNEVGPRWRQRQPVPINRWQTLLIKWTVVAVVTAVLTALMLLVADGVLGMDTPDPPLLWAFTWLCAASVGIGTIVLFAVVGTFGQLIALLLFVYAGLASAGGTVPVEALPGLFRALSYVEPLRQILAGTRSIMYFGARGDAGLTRGTLTAGLGLLLWLLLGAVVVRWYDRRRLYRIHPDLLAHVNASVEQYLAHGAPGSSSGPHAEGSPIGESDREEPHPPSADAPDAPPQGQRPAE